MMIDSPRSGQPRAQGQPADWGLAQRRDRCSWLSPQLQSAYRGGRKGEERAK